MVNWEMEKTYSSDEITLELASPDTPRDVRQAMEECRVRAACRDYGLTFTPLWLTETGRITLAQIVAAKLSGRSQDAALRVQIWERWVLEQGDA